MTAENNPSTTPETEAHGPDYEASAKLMKDNPGIMIPMPKQRLPGIGSIHEAIAAIMAEVGGVGKTRKNEQQGYKFRGIADIKLACQPLMAKHGVHLSPHAVLHEETAERTTKSGATMMHIRQRVEFRFYHADGSYFPCITTGEAMDSGDKASNKAMSAAMKYALDQVFCLPEEDPDLDTENKSPELGTKVPAKAPEAPKTTAGPVPEAPADPLTDLDILNLSDLAKSAGFKTRGELLPLLKEFGGGATALKLMDRAYLGDLVSELKRLAQPKAPTPSDFGRHEPECVCTEHGRNV